MIRHLLKLAWNRKRSNALVTLEIFASFLVVVAVVTLSLQLARNYRRPLGFSHQDVWSVRVEMRNSTDEAWLPEDRETFGRLLQEVRSMDGVLAAAGAFSVPYDNSTIQGVWNRQGRDIFLEFDDVTDEFRDVLGLTLTRGRWFAPSDSGLAWKPVVIDEEMSHAWFGAEDPLGRPLPLDEGDVETRVVGVVTDFRKNGEFSSPAGFLFTRARLDGPSTRPPRNLVLKVRPGLDAQFEQTVVARLQSMARGWSFELRRLEQMRESSFRLRVAPVLAGLVVAAFLLLMVGLGLLGVLWQNVTRRTQEIGLRRAAGASRAAIYRQVLLEVLLTTALGLLAGVLLVVQVPLLDLLPSLDREILGLGLGLSAALICMLTLSCGIYPGILAARIRPAEALHQE